MAFTIDPAYAAEVRDLLGNRIILGIPLTADLDGYPRYPRNSRLSSDGSSSVVEVVAGRLYLRTNRRVRGGAGRGRGRSCSQGVWYALSPASGPA